MPSSPRMLLTPIPAEIESPPEPPMTKLPPSPAEMLSEAPIPDPDDDTRRIRLLTKSIRASSPTIQSVCAAPERVSAPTPPISTAKPPLLVRKSVEPAPDVVVEKELIVRVAGA